MKALGPKDLNFSYDQQQVDELVEKFNKKLKERGIVYQISLETLKPYLEKACNLQPNENLVGIVIDKDTITFKIEQKNKNSEVALGLE